MPLLLGGRTLDTFSGLQLLQIGTFHRYKHTLQRKYEVNSLLFFFFKPAI